jgi:hypothetical protein
MQRNTALNATALGVYDSGSEEGHGGGSIGGYLSTVHLDAAKRAFTVIKHPQQPQISPTPLGLLVSHDVQMSKRLKTSPSSAIRAPLASISVKVLTSATIVSPFKSLTTAALLHKMKSTQSISAAACSSTSRTKLSCIS